MKTFKLTLISLLFTFSSFAYELYEIMNKATEIVEQAREHRVEIKGIANSALDHFFYYYPMISHLDVSSGKCHKSLFGYVQYNNEIQQQEIVLCDKVFSLELDIAAEVFIHEAIHLVQMPWPIDKGEECRTSALEYQIVRYNHEPMASAYYSYNEAGVACGVASRFDDFSGEFKQILNTKVKSGFDFLFWSFRSTIHRNMALDKRLRKLILKSNKVDKQLILDFQNSDGSSLMDLASKSNNVSIIKFLRKLNK